jgi:tetratricopeptide (TPR) repeat protein
MVTDSAQNSADRRLDSWKEIAAFFGRDERTVKRWEKERGLPVHRVPGGGRGTVFAFSQELTDWLRSSQLKEPAESGVKEGIVLVPPDEGGPIRMPVERHWGMVGAVVTLAFLSLVAFGFTRFYNLHSVHGHLLPSLSPRVSSEAHQNAEELYLQGRYHWNKRTPEDLTQAEDDFAKSSQLDPNYALAYAGTADCYNLLREYTHTPASQTFPLAIAAARKSIELDPELSEGHRALAFALFHWDWDVDGAEREFKRAIELNPKDVEAHHWYATALMPLARYPEAIAQIEVARQLDPSSSSIAADRAMILYASGRTEQSIEILRELEIAEPNFSSTPNYLARIYFEQRQYEKYFAEAEVAAKLSHDDGALASIQVSRREFKSGGEKALLQGLLEEQLESFREGRTDAISVAMIYACQGNTRETMDYLEKAYQRHDYGLISVRGWTRFKGMGDDQQFQDLMKRIYSRSSSTGKV